MAKKWAIKDKYHPSNGVLSLVCRCLGPRRV
jgi:hypothetical protein